MTIAEPPVLKYDILDSGSIELIDCMGDDLGIFNNAQASFDRSMSPADYRSSEEARERVNGVIRFMMRERHGSPFERPVFTFRVKAPIFVMREWHRHRHASINEESMRYSLKENAEFYHPEPSAIRRQVGKPGAYSFERIADPFIVNDARDKIELAQHFAFRTYRDLIDMGVAKEVARVVVPVGTYSTMVWQANLRSILNFLSLRNSDQAQAEIREYAVAMEKLVKLYVPMTMEAFQEYGRRVP